MKVYMRLIWSALVVLVCMSAFAGNGDKGHHIKIKINNLKDTAVYLANYYGDKQYIQDTSKADVNGIVVFKGDEPLNEGIYLVVIPSKKYFELIIDKNQHFSVETDTLDFLKKTTIKGSEDNKLFYDYLLYINAKAKIAEDLKGKMEKAKANKDSAAFFKDKLAVVEKEVKSYKSNFIKDHPKSFVTTIFKAMTDPEVPESPKLANGRVDSLFPYYYYKNHYWDNIDFADERLLRTPIFANKLKQYMEKMVVQHPDSIKVACDYLGEKARANKEVFKYVIYYLTYTYESSNIMGMDAVFVHMVNNYYKTNQAYWIDSTQLAKIVNRSNTLEPLLLGKFAPNIKLQDTLGRPSSFYDIKAKYTILFFWDYDCSHCKKVAPKLLEFYQKYKSKGVEVYAVSTQYDKALWVKFIKENNLNWINAWDMYHATNFKKTYDIYSTPVIYLLDDKKKIVAKRLDVEQLGDFVERLEKDKTKSAKAN